eukprot:TRINITY_DN19398_c0_g2_i1.p1 TRINITY_DN19398_c0_g2~~TRINITY_DN19398_c0_g2_i1.p1  ORF type:complete len:384 (+),score=117.45 TRINITY_DN19398_c0_g2_i1:134-1285(+)
MDDSKRKRDRGEQSSEEEGRDRERRREKKVRSKEESEDEDYRKDRDRHHKRKKEGRRKEQEQGDSSDDDSSEEDRKRRREKKAKRRDASDEEDEKRRRKKKEEKREKRRKRRRQEEEDEEEDRKKKKLLKEAKKYLKAAEGKEGKVASTKPREKMVPVSNTVQVDPIAHVDYFSKNPEFATWLLEQRGVYFSNLTSEESYALFPEFVELWNGRKLSEKYYVGIDKAPRTSHQWKIKETSSRSDVLLPLMGDDPQGRDDRRAREKLERKRLQKDHELVVDELLPGKATGRETLQEKKAAQREANRAREVSPEPMKERDLMGGGDDFQKRLAMVRSKREKKASEKAGVFMEKQAAYVEQENATMDHFKAMINMAGGKIMMPRRTD